MATIFMPRNKSSIIRSSSANGRPSYPYPRSHTPLMIIPSSRPVLEHPEASSSRQNSYGNRRGREHEQRPRRRPPLNTAIPTIPESKSNESIMSHISRVSVNNNDKSENTLPSDAGCVIIENPTATAGIPRLTTSANIQSSSTNIDVSNNNVASTSSGSNRRRDKRANTMGTSKNLNERTSTNSSAPLSPLMSVAHSVRSKLSKLTRIRSRSNSTERSNSIKTSQSFSGIRPTPKAKVPPKRIDENANRVIKSSSMDVKLSSNVPSTSKVVIPQNPEPLCSDDEPSICDNNNPKEILHEKLKEVETLPLQSEVIVEECETNRTEKELPSVFPDNENLSLKLVNDEVTEKIQSPVSIHEEVHTVIKAERRSQIPLSVSFSMEPICVSPSPVVESPGDKENSLSSSIYKNMEDSIDSKSTSQTARQVLHATNRQDGSTTTTTTTITTTTTVVKTVSGELEKKIDSIESQAISKVPSIASYSKTERMKRSKSEDQPAQRRYIMTVKTPECLRRHKTFVIGESQPATETERIIMESRKKVKRSNPIRSKSMEDKSAPKYILLTKTPLQLNDQHQKFVIGECQGKDQVSCKSTVKPLKRKKPKRSVSCEEPRAQERFILISKTPLMLRKHNTFVVGEADSRVEVESAVTTVEALVSPKKQKKVRSPSPEEPRSPERYVMIAKTPLTSRKHQTFVVGEADPKVEVNSEVTTMEALVSPKKQKKVRSPSPEEPRSPERYVMIAKTPLTSRKHQNFVVGEADPKVEVDTEVTTMEALVSPKKQKKVRSPSPEEPRSPERYVMIAKTPLTTRKHQAFVVGEADPKAEVDTEVTTMEALVSPKKQKKVRSPSPEEPRSPERYVMIAKTPLTTRKHQAFVVGEADPKAEVDTEVTTMEALVSPKKQKKVRSPSPEEPRSPERYVMIAKTPLTSRKHQNFVVGEADPKVEVDTEVTTMEALVSPKKQKKVRSPSPEEPRSPERYVMIAKTPLTSRKHQNFVVGEADPKVEVDREVTTMEALVSPKKQKKVRSPSPEEPRSPERYVMIAKTPLTTRKHQAFVVGEADPKAEVDTEVTTMEALVSPKKQKKVRSPSPEEPRSPERYVMIAKTPLTTRKHQAFVVGEAEPGVEVNTEVTTVEALVSPKKQKKIRSPSPEEPRSPERYVMIAKTPLTSRKHQNFVVGEADSRVEVESAVTTVEDLVSPKKQKKVRSPSPEEPRSPERYVMIAKTPLSTRKHQAFVVGEAGSEPQVEVSEKVKVHTVCKEIKKTKAIVRQRSTPEQSTVPRERFVLVTKTPLTIRRHNTFMIGERPRSPDVPWIEEGELTEPIATVGPLAHKARTKSEEPRKQFRVDDEDKPQERFILTSRTPLPLRKFTTFVVENKKTDLPSSQSECTNLQRGRETTRVKKEKLKSSSTFTAADRSKSPYEEELKSPERFIMKATTPLALRKYNQFSIQEKKKSIDLPETTDDEDKGPRRRMKTSEMYCLTATTPLLTRKSPKEEIPPDDDDIMKSSSLARDVSFSPERTTLFVMGRRSPVPIERRPDPSSLHLDGIQENSQSDRAERKMSVISGEMTSPEEEIPMDTQQTPSEDEGAEIHFPLRSICIRTSPIPEETFIRKDQRPPVFCAPSPPRAVLSSKSTSPIKTSESRPEISTSSSLSSTKELSKRERKLAAKADKKKEEKEKPAKVQLATRSLRSAGRMFAPSFFRRSERRLQKAAVPPKSMSFSSNRPAMDISFNSRRAPLAEFESTVVENSPLVENHPITFDKWNNSPWSRRRFADQAFAQTIKEESDGNGNFNSSSFDRSVGSPLLGRNHDQDKGLIDDEILDQPMLVGDTFSHSESMDRLSAVRHMEAFEAEKATLISIDRSLAEDVDSSAIIGVTNSVIIPTTSVPAVPSTITRRSDNGNSRPAQSIITPFYTSNITSHSNLQCNLEQGLNEVKDIKDQLQKLRDIVEQESVRAEDETKESLIRENDALRRQLIEQDNIIKALKQQIALLKST